MNQLKPIIMKALIAASPIIAKILIAILIGILLMLPIIYATQIIGAAVTGIDKFINLTTGRGFNTSQEAYFIKLEHEYKKYDLLRNKIGEFDAPLIATTTHYNQIFDSGGYTDEDEDEDEDEKNNEDEYEFDSSNHIVPSTQLTDFYAIANNELGSAYTLFPGQAKLIGHLIDTRITFERCVNVVGVEDVWRYIIGEENNPFDQAWEELKYLINDFALHLLYTGEDTFKDVLSKGNLLNIARLIYFYETNDKSYFATELKNISYEMFNDNIISNLIRIIEQSSFNRICAENQISFPTLQKFINYDLYKKYLKEVYLPEQPYNKCDVCRYNFLIENKEKVEAEELLDRQIREIFEQRDGFDYLYDNLRRTHMTHYLPGNASLPIATEVGKKWRNYVSRGFDDRKQSACYDRGIKESNTGCNHFGIDFSRVSGWPVLAIGDGVVVQAVESYRGYGFYITIGHDINDDGQDDYYSRYAHLSAIMVSNGQQIGGGQQIGKVGSTGNSSGPHLHFEIIDPNRPSGPPAYGRIDPTPYLDAIEEGTSVFEREPIVKLYIPNSDPKEVYYPSTMTNYLTFGNL